MRLLSALLATLALLSAAAQAQPRLRSLGAEGGDFRAELSDGRVLHGRDLVGATIAIDTSAGAIRLRIAAAAPEGGGFAPDVWLFDLRTVAAEGDAPYCDPDPKGMRLAIPYSGANGAIALTCTSGAVGKCFRMGYRPWIHGLEALHAACVNLVRGDYGGNDRPWTRNGMLIDVFDDSGVQSPDTDNPMPFEAGWTPEGAVCLAHPRVPENGSLAAIESAVPRLAGRTGAGCTEEEARRMGAILFNRSKVAAAP